MKKAGSKGKRFVQFVIGKEFDTPEKVADAILDACEQIMKEARVKKPLKASARSGRKQQ